LDTNVCPTPQSEFLPGASKEASNGQDRSDEAKGDNGKSGFDQWFWGLALRNDDEEVVDLLGLYDDDSIGDSITSGSDPPTGE